MATLTTTAQDRGFGERVWGVIENLLGDALENEDASWVVEWVASNFEPQDVFEVSELDAWAESNGYVLEN